MLAIRFPFRGGTVWAVSDSEAYTGRLDESASPSFWYADGDSLRFPDGQIVPGRVGGLRRAFPGALLRADNVDDTEGSYIVTCEHLMIEHTLGQVDELNDTSATRLDARPLPATLSVWRVRVDSAKARPDPALKAICATT